MLHDGQRAVLLRCHGWKEGDADITHHITAPRTHTQHVVAAGGRDRTCSAVLHGAIGKCGQKCGNAVVAWRAWGMAATGVYRGTGLRGRRRESVDLWTYPRGRFTQRNGSLTQRALSIEVCVAKQWEAANTSVSRARVVAKFFRNIIVKAKTP